MSTVVIQRVLESDNYVWDPGTMAWVKETQPAGGGGGAATIADGADVAEGATTDVAVQGDNPGTVSAKLRGLNKSIAAGLPVSWAAAQHVIVDTAPTTAVTNANLDSPLSGIKSDLDEIAVDTDNLALIKAKTDNLDVALSTRLAPADTLAKVTTVDTITNPVTVVTTNTTVTGTLTNPDDTVTMAVAGLSTVQVYASGTFNIASVFEGSLDGGVTWGFVDAIGNRVFHQEDPQYPVFWSNSLRTTQQQAYLIPSRGLTHIRVRAVTVTSGPMTVQMVGSVAAFSGAEFRQWTDTDAVDPDLGFDPVLATGHYYNPVSGFWERVQGSSGALNTAVASLPLPSNAAKETGGNLDTIAADVARIPVPGTALASASLPVTLAPGSLDGVELLLRATILRLDLLCSMVDHSYTPVDTLALQ